MDGFSDKKIKALIQGLWDSGMLGHRLVHDWDEWNCASLLQILAPKLSFQYEISRIFKVQVTSPELKVKFFQKAYFLQSHHRRWGQNTRAEQENDRTQILEPLTQKVCDKILSEEKIHLSLRVLIEHSDRGRKYPLSPGLGRRLK